MGRIAAGVWRGYRELPALVEVWASAPPLQALARLHAVVAADVEPAAELGRPRSGELLNDSLRLGAAPAAEEAAARLSLLGRVVGSGSSAPAVVEAAAVHAELLALRPSRPAQGSWRDEHAAGPRRPRVGSRPAHRAGGRHHEARAARLWAAARQYLGGTPEGVTAWLTYFAEVVAMGAAAAAEILVGIRAKGLGKGAGVE